MEATGIIYSADEILLSAGEHAHGVELEIVGLPDVGGLVGCVSDMYTQIRDEAKKFDQVDLSMFSPDKQAEIRKENLDKLNAIYAPVWGALEANIVQHENLAADKLNAVKFPMREQNTALGSSEYMIGIEQSKAPLIRSCTSALRAAMSEGAVDRGVAIIENAPRTPRQNQTPEAGVEWDQTVKQFKDEAGITEKQAEYDQVHATRQALVKIDTAVGTGSDNSMTLIALGLIALNAKNTYKI